MPGERGHCPCCFRVQSTRGGAMVKHGYKAPGRGRGYAPHVGSGCIAYRMSFPPLEASPAGTDYVIAAAESDLDGTRNRLAALLENPDGVLLLVRVENPAEKGLRSFQCKGLPRHVSREEVEAKTVPFLRFAEDRWSKLLERAVFDQRHRADCIRGFLAEARDIRARFHPAAEAAG